MVIKLDFVFKYILYGRKLLRILLFIFTHLLGKSCKIGIILLPQANQSSLHPPDKLGSPGGIQNWALILEAKCLQWIPNPDDLGLFSL